ncbi:hypothetical protein CC80DRAFT_543407 [Byssothecium circinans]|uniref:Uncharacterized protein n=1 Tax=Byssothecium circinans TaxID=147558 RepID=A0A6A5UDK9_9PLEO|nr:hypothetical protein CC80DRAFT_543407 [Byssothecium circinans]
MKLFLAFTMLGLASLAFAVSAPVQLQVRDFDPSRVADGQLWGRHTCKGRGLMYSMADPAAIQSEWKGDLKKELQTWGYKEVAPGYMICDMKGYWSQATACQALGLDTRPKENPNMGGSNICYKIEHFDDQNKNVPKKEQTYMADGKQYRVTGASFELAVNPVQGAIFQQYVNSPKNSASNLWNKVPSNDELPKLRALSDILWGVWNRQNSNVRNIRYFWVQGVGNTKTKASIARGLRNAGKSLGKWPGTTFTMDTEEGLALLGSENGACFGFFLATHKAELGALIIEKVTVFRDDRTVNVDPDLVFHVKGVAKAQMSEDDLNGSTKEVGKEALWNRTNVVEIHDVGV